MITLFIYGLIAISIASAAAYGFVVFARSSHQLTVLQQNQVRMSSAAAAIRAALLPLNGDGTLFPPLGINGGAYSQLPALGIVSATPWGMPYLYCPVSPTGNFNRFVGNSTAPDNAITSPDGTSYAITNYPALQNQNIPYVLTSNAPASLGGGYAAFIVSSAPQQGAAQPLMPSCTDILVTPGGVRINPAASRGGVPISGAVVGVSGGFSYAQRNAVSTDRMELYVGGTTTGDTTGRDTANLTTLDKALALWKGLLPRLTIIYLQANAGGYSTTNNLNAEDVRRTAANNSLAQGEDTSLIITPFTGAASVPLTLSGPLTITSNVTLQNLAVTDTSTATPAITIYKSLTLRSNTSMSFSTASAMQMYNGELTVIDGSIGRAGAYTTIGGSNSTINLLNFKAAVNTFSNVSFTGALMTINMDYTLDPDRQNAVTLNAVTENFIGTTTPTIVPIFNVSASTINIGRNVTLSEQSYTAPIIRLYASKLNVSGTISVTPAPPSIINQIEALAGSTINLTSVPADTSVGLNVGGVLLQGSGLAINKPVTAQAGLSSEEGTITGTSNIAKAAGSNCFQIYRVGGTLPLWTVPAAAASATLPGAGYPDSKYGLPPLLTYSPQTTPYPPNNQAAAAAMLTGNPYIKYTGTGAGNNYGVADDTPNGAPAFEAAVRNVINFSSATTSEFINGGLHVNLLGTCT